MRKVSSWVLDVFAWQHDGHSQNCVVDAPRDLARTQLKRHERGIHSATASGDVTVLRRAPRARSVCATVSREVQRWPTLTSQPSHLAPVVITDTAHTHRQYAPGSPARGRARRRPARAESEVHWHCPEVESRGRPRSTLAAPPRQAPRPRARVTVIRFSVTRAGLCLRHRTAYYVSPASAAMTRVSHIFSEYELESSEGQNSDVSEGQQAVRELSAQPLILG